MNERKNTYSISFPHRLIFTALVVHIFTGKKALKNDEMRCITANRSVLIAIDQKAVLIDDDRNNCTAMTNDIDSIDTIQFANE